MAPRFSYISPHLYVRYGHVNTSILRDGSRALLIDASGNSVHTTLAKLGITPGGTVQLRVEITNHSTEQRAALAKPVIPPSWNLEIGPVETTIPPKTDGNLVFSIPIPDDDDILKEKQKIVIPVQLIYDARPLGEFREAIFILKHP